MTTGEKIAQLRSEYGLSQEELADKLNVSRQTVYKWESDLALPKKEYLKQLVELFATTYDYLLDDDHEEVKEEVTEEVKEEVKEEIKEVVIPKSAPEVIVVTAPQPQTSVVPLAICQKCKKIITAEDDLVRISGSYDRQGNQAADTVYCASCNKDVVERQKLAEEARIVSENLKVKVYKSLARRQFWTSFILGLLVTGLILGIGLSQMLPNPNTQHLLILIGSSILAFFLVSCLVLRNNGAWIVLSTVSSWGIKFPGLIFTLDIDGIVWVILVKGIFGIISIVIGVIMFVLGLAVSGIISIFMYPFALVKNFKNPQDKSNALEDLVD